jgi:hypothetical protein
VTHSQKAKWSRGYNRFIVSLNFVKIARFFLAVSACLLGSGLYSYTFIGLSALLNFRPSETMGQLWAVTFFALITSSAQIGVFQTPRSSSEVDKGVEKTSTDVPLSVIINE